MMNTHLLNTIDELKARVLQLEARHQDDKNRYHYLLEQFRLAQHNRFGKSSESQPAQLDLFNEIEEEVTIESAEDDEKTISYTRKKPIRQRLPDDLPRTVIIHDIEDKACDCCGHELHEMGRDISEKLTFIPAKVEVTQHVRPKYACRHCDTQGTTFPIKQAPVPASPIPKGIATSSLLAKSLLPSFNTVFPSIARKPYFNNGV